MDNEYFLDESDYNDLRDPTIEELHSGPTRDSLPEDVKAMKDTETACTYCGVSYLVFSEVQSLRQKLKDNLSMHKVVFNSLIPLNETRT